MAVLRQLGLESEPVGLPELMLRLGEGYKERSLLDTERLLLHGDTAEGKLNEEKAMILNHKEAIRYLVDNASRIEVSRNVICTLHYLLSEPTMESLKSGIIPQKRAILEKALGGKTDKPADSLEYVRFVKSKSDLLDISAGISARTMGLRSIKGPFDYRSKSGHFNCVVNFGDPGLFRFWETHCFAQDEIQVMEHPDLGRLQKYLSGWFTSPWTETLMGTATPWLIKGVKRHCKVDSSSMYGWKLAKLSPDQVKRNISRIRNPTTSNILVMTAPSLSNHSQGQRYSSAEILKLFYAAYTAFKGAKQEAQRLGQPLSIQTGNWGSGAFGNDAALMAVIQILAFRFAGGDHLDYFTYDTAGQNAFNRAQKFIESLDSLQLSGATPTLGSVLRIVYQADFLHGKSNGR